MSPLQRIRAELGPGDPAAVTGAPEVDVRCVRDHPFNLEDIRRTIWLTRPDLQRLFADSPEGFDWWLLWNGTREYAAVRELGPPVDTCLLDEPAPQAHQDVFPTLTRFMKELWASRPDLKKAFDLSRRAGQQAFVRWYFLHGVPELGLARLITLNQRRELETPVTELRVTPKGKRRRFLGRWRRSGRVRPEDGTVTWIMATVWQDRPDLQEAFDLREADERAAFAEWFEHKGIYEYGLAQVGTDEYNHRPAEGLPFGLNLIGYAKGQFGIGEDVRMAAAACEAAGIPFSIYNIEPGAEVDQGDRSVMGHVGDELPYAVNLFCTTGIETARLAAVHGRQLFEGRYCIGYWPWELPRWPSEWAHAYRLVDEVWASSEFTWGAYRENSPVRVRHMPMAVEVQASDGLGRADFGLPEDAFLFAFSFDFLSSATRKNPEGCIRAFREAFPAGTECVGLVIKAMRGQRGDPGWQRLREAADRDARIHLVEQTLSRGAVLDLYRAADCFVSLHRAEGFGRGMAEAMRLGKPVIATAWSGNTDFIDEQTAAPVGYELVALRDGDYPWGKGQYWAEPDPVHAAAWMRRLANDADLARQLAEAGQRKVNEAYAPGVVGRSYAAALRTILGQDRPGATQNTITERQGEMAHGG